MIVALNTEVTRWKDDEDSSGEGSEGENEEPSDSEDEQGQGSGDDADDQDSDEEDGNGDSSDGEEGEESSGSDSGDDSQDGEEGEESSDGNGEGGETDEDADPSASGGGDGDPSDGEPQNTEGDDEGESDGDCQDSSSSSPEEDGLPDKDIDDHSAGGHDPNEAKTLAEKLMEGWENGEEDGLKDNNSALEGAVEAAAAAEQGTVRYGEKLWRSPFPTTDTMALAGKASPEIGRALRNQARAAAAAIKAKLRNKLLQARVRQQVHGVRRGRGLSSRRLVHTMTEIKANRRPTRPDWRNVQRPDVTLSAALVMDQSGSMQFLTRNAALGAFALGDALTPLGCPTLIIGPRDNRSGYHGQDAAPNAHRYYPVHIDIFKDWGEDMGVAQERIPTLRAAGGTPLSDGIQMALLELQERTENHRVICVLTDGEPNCPAVVRRQIRLAEEAGIHVIGVGIGDGASAVKTQFPNAHVSVSDISELAPALVEVLLGLIFPKNASTKKNFSWG